MALSLAVYALFRMDALGVNLTAIPSRDAWRPSASPRRPRSTTSAASRRLDSTCRIGDWIRLDGGPARSSRSAGATAITTINNVTTHHPERLADGCPRDIITAAAAGAFTWRRPVESASAEWTGRCFSVVRGALVRSHVPFVANTPAADASAPLRPERDQMRRLLLIPIRSYLTPILACGVHVFAAPGRAGMEIQSPGQTCSCTRRAASSASKSTVEQETRVALAPLELFAPLTDDEHALATRLIPTPFRRGDIATKRANPRSRSTSWRADKSPSSATLTALPD